MSLKCGRDPLNGQQHDLSAARTYTPILDHQPAAYERRSTVGPFGSDPAGLGQLTHRSNPLLGQFALSDP